MGVAHMDDGGRRCALPGCDRTITITAGRPERRYCTAAHRAVARRARRAAVPAGQPDGPDAPADALPWVRDAIGTGAARAGDPGEPAAEPVRPGRPAEVTPAPDVASGSRARRPTPRRRHALVLLGVAGILAGGYSVSVTDAAPEPLPVQTAPEGTAAPDGAVADTWAQRATVALASVNRQLDTLAQIEDEWRRLPGSGRAVAPAPVAALEERRSVLQRRRAILQAQLDDYRSLRRTEQELANSEQHLRAVETALAGAPPRRLRSAEQEAAITALEEQRDLRIRRRDVQRTELASLQDGVATATRAPLPDDGAVTAAITGAVMEMVHNGGTEPVRPDPLPARPEVPAGREPGYGNPRQEVGTGGPPGPRGPRDESDESDESDERWLAKEKRAANTDGEARKPKEPTSPARGEQSVGTPVEVSVGGDAAQSHDRRKDREPPENDAVQRRAQHRRTEMPEPSERKPAGTDSAECGSQYRHTDKSGSKDGDVHGRHATEHRAEDRDSRQHGEVEKRTSTDRESEDREPTSRRKAHDSKGHDATGRGVADRDSERCRSPQHGSTMRNSEDDDAHHRHASDVHRAGTSRDRGDGGSHRGAAR